MASDVSSVVYRYFNDNITRVPDIDRDTAIFYWLGEQGYEQAHKSDRWKAYALDAGYHYVGDLDIEIKVATGAVALP